MLLEETEKETEKIRDEIEKKVLGLVKRIEHGEIA